MTEELLKATLGYTHTVNVEGEDVEFFAKAEILPTDRIDGDYKITMAIRRAHGQGEVTDQAILAAFHYAQDKATAALDTYFAKGGRQLILRFSAPESDDQDDTPKASRTRTSKRVTQLLTNAALGDN